MAAASIRAARSAQDMVTARYLFEAYARSLAIDLSYQGFGAELTSLPGRYAPPAGVLLLAWLHSGEACGCVAVRGLPEPGVGELKRLYVVHAARGLGLGRALVAAAINEAKRLGHRKLVLDSLQDMHVAIALYRAMGFAPVAPYGDCSPAATVFLGLDLLRPPNTTQGK